MSDKVKERKKSAGSGSGTIHGYRVEARIKLFEDEPEGGLLREPIQLVDGTILGANWKQLHFERSGNPAGVPLREFTVGDYDRYQTMPYESALALAWMVVAQNPHRSIECRLVRYKAEYSYTISRCGYVDGVTIAESWHPDIRIVDDTDAAEATK